MNPFSLILVLNVVCMLGCNAHTVDYPGRENHKSGYGDMGYEDKDLGRTGQNHQDRALLNISNEFTVTLKRVLDSHRREKDLLTKANEELRGTNEALNGEVNRLKIRVADLIRSKKEMEGKTEEQAREIEKLKGFITNKLSTSVHPEEDQVDLDQTDTPTSDKDAESKHKSKKRKRPQEHKKQKLTKADREKPAKMNEMEDGKDSSLDNDEEEENQDQAEEQQEKGDESEEDTESKDSQTDKESEDQQAEDDGTGPQEEEE